MQEALLPQLKAACARVADLAHQHGDHDFEQDARQLLVRVYLRYPQAVGGENAQFVRTYAGEYVPAGVLTGGNQVRAAVLRIDTDSSGEGTEDMYNQQ